MRKITRVIRVQWIAAASVAAIVVATTIALALNGTVVLRDPYQEVASAHVIDGWGKRQELAFVGFAYFAVPKLEGTVELRCANGKVVRSGYVTPGASTWQTVGKEVDCGKA